MQSASGSRGKLALFWLLLLALPALVLWLAVPVAWRQLEQALRPELVSWVANHLSPEERARIEANVASMATGMFRIIPDPLVGRIGRSHFSTVEKEADIQLNNAGMRSAVDYGPKPPDTYRILCVGDSFVFGTGGPVEDRFCQQIEDFYRDHGITVQGRRVEVLVLGLPSWNLRQAAAYLIPRLDAYAPDLVLWLTVQNDISDTFGVTENGALTTAYASDRRDVGSGVFTNVSGQVFGGGVYSALTTDLGPTPQRYWREAFDAVGRLVELQHRRQGRVLLAVLEHPARHAGYYVQLFSQYAAETGAPFIRTSSFAGKQSRLPHDGHPNRYGHRLLATHYIRQLAQLGWVPVPEAQWPQEDRMHPENHNPPVDAQALAQERETFLREHVRPALDFTRLDLETAASLLGGIFPEVEGRLPDGEPPWASVRAGFLLQKPARAGDAVLALSLQWPDCAALYPLPLAVTANGQLLARIEIPAERAGSAETVRLPLAASLLAQYPALEVLLETPRHCAGIEDHRMKSYRLMAAAVE